MADVPKRRVVNAGPGGTKLSPWVLDLIGAVCLWLAFMRFGIAELGWVAFAPFLVALHRDGSVRHHAWLFAVLLVAMIAALFKIVTEEISPVIAFMFGVPAAVLVFVALAAAGAAHRRLGTRWGVYAFPAMIVALGWVQYTFTPGSSWGAPAHTQADNLALVQLASLAGIGGVSFLVALGSSFVAAALSSGVRAIRRDLVGFALVLGGAFVFGELRLSHPAPGPEVRVGSVVAPTTFREFHAARSHIDALRAFDDELFARSADATELGAQAVVWNEVATFVTPEGEPALTARGQAFAKQHGVLLMMAYGVLVSAEPFRWRNKYRVILPDGTIADTYVKRHPVPGDGDIAGRERARVIHFAGANVAGAICYDYGFPQIARDNARSGAGIALVPSSDWKGIDPLHAQMARMNAVAAGVAMVRPVRAATSLTTDAYGRVLGAMRADPGSSAVMVTSVPSGRVPTLYASIGEVVPLAALAFDLLVVLLLLRRRTTRATSGALPRHGHAHGSKA